MAVADIDFRTTEHTEYTEAEQERPLSVFSVFRGWKRNHRTRRIHGKAQRGKGQNRLFLTESRIPDHENNPKSD